MSIDKIRALIADYKDRKLTMERFLEKFDWELKQGLHFSNLDERNRKLIFEAIRKHEKGIREGWWPSETNIRDAMYAIHKDRVEADMTDDDLKDMREILEMFKK